MLNIYNQSNADDLEAGKIYYVICENRKYILLQNVENTQFIITESGDFAEYKGNYLDFLSKRFDKRIEHEIYLLKFGNKIELTLE